MAENLLILKQGDKPAIIGQLTMLAEDRFQFKLPGDVPNDAGLTFAK